MRSVRLRQPHRTTSLHYASPLCTASRRTRFALTPPLPPLNGPQAARPEVMSELRRLEGVKVIPKDEDLKKAHSTSRLKGRGRGLCGHI